MLNYDNIEAGYHLTLQEKSHSDIFVAELRSIGYTGEIMVAGSRKIGFRVSRYKLETHLLEFPKRLRKQYVETANRIALEKSYCAGEGFKVLDYLSSDTPQLVIAYFSNWDLTKGADLDLCLDTDTIPAIDPNLLTDKEYPIGTSLQIDLWCKDGYLKMFRKKQ